MTTPAEADDLVDRLRRFALRAGRRGEPLPGEPTLAQALGVSRPSLREGLARLESEGLIGRRKGAETAVNPGALEMIARFDHQVEYADLLAAAGFEPSMELLEAGVTRLPAESAVRLRRDAGIPALRTVKRWRADGRAVMVAIDIVPAPDGGHENLHEADPGSGLFELVRRISGTSVTWELAWPGAEVPKSHVRGWLETAPDAAALTLDLVGVARNGARAYHALEYHVPGAVPSGFIRTVRS